MVRKYISDDQVRRVSTHVRTHHAFPKYANEREYKEIKWKFGLLLHCLPVDIVRYVFSFAKPTVKNIWRAPNVYSPVKFHFVKEPYDKAVATVSVRVIVTRVRVHGEQSSHRDFHNLQVAQRYLLSMNQEEATMTHSCKYTYTGRLFMKFRRQEWMQEFNTADEAFLAVLNVAHENGYD